MARNRDKIKHFIRLPEPELKEKINNHDKKDFFWGYTKDEWVVIDGDSVLTFNSYDELVNKMEN